jgi:transcriptional regulator with XRE-family HTH domain
MPGAVSGRRGQRNWPQAGRGRRTDAVRAQKEERIWRLRLQGYSQRAIGEEVGMTQSSVSVYLQRRIRDMLAPYVEEYRRLEDARFDYYLEKLTPAIENGNYRAILAAVKIAERRAKMWGTDAVAEIEDNTLNHLTIQMQPQGTVTRQQFEEIKQRRQLVAGAIEEEMSADG